MSKEKLSSASETAETGTTRRGFLKAALAGAVMGIIAANVSACDRAVGHEGCDAGEGCEGCDGGVHGCDLDEMRKINNLY